MRAILCNIFRLLVAGYVSIYGFGIAAGQSAACRSALITLDRQVKYAQEQTDTQIFLLALRAITMSARTAETICANTEDLEGYLRSRPIPAIGEHIVPGDDLSFEILEIGPVTSNNIVYTSGRDSYFESSVDGVWLPLTIKFRCNLGFDERCILRPETLFGTVGSSGILRQATVVLSDSSYNIFGGAEITIELAVAIWAEETDVLLIYNVPSSPLTLYLSLNN